jgi:hypothetical protein
LQELSQGTLGGVFTTVEGLLTKIHKSLLENNPFSVGDSTTLHHSADPSVYDVRSLFFNVLIILDFLHFLFRQKLASLCSWLSCKNWVLGSVSHLLWCSEIRWATVSSRRHWVPFYHLSWITISP